MKERAMRPSQFEGAQRTCPEPLFLQVHQASYRPMAAMEREFCQCFLYSGWVVPLLGGCLFLVTHSQGATTSIKSLLIGREITYPSHPS